MLGINIDDHQPINQKTLTEYAAAFAWTCRVGDLKGEKLCAEPKIVIGLENLGPVSDVHDYGCMWNLLSQMHREMFGGYGMVIYHFWMRWHGQRCMDVAYSAGLRRVGIGALGQTGAELKHQGVRRRLQESCMGGASGQKPLKRGRKEPEEEFARRTREHAAELATHYKSSVQEVMAGQFRDLHKTHGAVWSKLSNAAVSLPWCAPVGQDSYLTRWGREGQITEELLGRVAHATAGCQADMRAMTADRLATRAAPRARFDARGFVPGAAATRVRGLAAAAKAVEVARQRAAVDSGSLYVAPHGLPMTLRAQSEGAGSSAVV